MRHLLPISLLICTGTALLACTEEPQDATTCIIKRNPSNQQVLQISGNCQGRDFSGVDLEDASIQIDDWTGVTCPDGTSSADHGNTCLGHLSTTPPAPQPDAGEPDTDEPADMSPDVPEALDLQEDPGPPEDLPEDGGVDVDTDLSDPEDVLTPDLEDMDAGAPDADTAEPDLPDMNEDEPDLDDPDACEGTDCFDTCLALTSDVEHFSPVSVTLPSTTWTLEFWFFPFELGAFDIDTAIRLEDDQSNSIEINLFGIVPEEDVDSGAVPLISAGSEALALAESFQISDQVLPSGRWHHIALDNTWNVYINGYRYQIPNEDLDSTLLNGLSRDATLKIGAGQFLNKIFQGHLRNLRISQNLSYSFDFTPSIRPVQGQDIHFWPLDNVFDGQALDLARSENLQVIPAVNQVPCP